MMPYLNKKISLHNKGCNNPDVKRLYIRDYDKKGMQRYVAYAVTCLDCGALVKEDKIDFNPTPKQLLKNKVAKTNRINIRSQNHILKSHQDHIKSDIENDIKITLKSDLKEEKQANKPVKIQPISKAELREMKQFGIVGTCKLCGKVGLKNLHGLSIFYDDGMTKEQKKKYLINGTHLLAYQMLYYPDKKPATDVDEISYDITICNQCSKKHYIHGYPSPEPKTKEAWKLVTIPYPKI